MNYADASRVGLLVAMTFVAVISMGDMVRSVRDADAVSAWIWAAMYAGSSLVASEGFYHAPQRMFMRTH